MSINQNDYGGIASYLVSSSALAVYGDFIDDISMLMEDALLATAVSGDLSDERRSDALKLLNNMTAYLRLSYLSNGLSGESGEFAGEVKKLLRNDRLILTDERKAKMLSELGDALWYLTQAAATLGATLDDIANMNITKLVDRKRSNTLNVDRSNG